MPGLRLLSLGFALLVANLARADQPVDYLRDVKPILARHCVACHSESKPRAGLRLDTAAHALKGAEAGPVVTPGQPADSILLEVLTAAEPSERMPLNRPPLSAQEIDTLSRWIAQGASAPPDEQPSVGTTRHWSFDPPVRTPAPVVTNSAWVRNPIDAYILAPLEQAGFQPSPEADRGTLLRRASLDLIGLPPSPAELESFLADTRPDAFERQVDRLLASPAYGERWARPWLDLARYADSNGYSIDAPRSIWKYRDWVIDALNRNQPFDDFTIDQIAGDLRPGATLDHKIATGFHRNTPINQEGGIDKEQFRIESILDRVNTTGSVWLGLTVGCAQCHDHKYDPISQKDYFRLFAFLDNVDEPDLPVASPEELERLARVEKEIADHITSIERDPELLALQKPWELALDLPGRQRQSQAVREAFDLPFDDRTPDRNRVIFAAFIDQSDHPSVAPHRQKIADLRKQIPSFITTMVVQERTTNPRTTRMLIAGDSTRPGDPIEPNVPEILPDLPPVPSGRPDRMALARWLVDQSNPLTARVTVNRLWQVYFGRGLVETESDFGTQGTLPSHPELLDWLATEFTRSGWDLKAIHRLIVTSATYRQSSAHRADLAAVDPDNRRLARQSRLRLDAELVRDTALAASGRLTPVIGGPSVFPPQPDGVMSLGQMRREWKPDTGPNRYRRALYTFLWRATPYPGLSVFDAPDPARTCTRRPRSNTPLQALTLLNDQAFLELAAALAERTLQLEASDSDRLQHLYRLSLSRNPTPRESDALLAYLADERAALAASPPAASTSHDLAAWTAVSRVVLNLDEFITRE